MTDEERDELLIRMDERVCTLVKETVPSVKERLANHIKYHWVVSVPAGLALFGWLIKSLVQRP
jgi:hypothetical protein